METKEERRKVIDQLIEDRVDELYKPLVEVQETKAKPSKKTAPVIANLEPPF